MARKSFADRVRERDNKELDESAQKLRTLTKVKKTTVPTNILTERTTERATEPVSESINDPLVELVSERLSYKPTDRASERATDRSSDPRYEPMIDRPIDPLHNLKVNFNDPIFWINENYAKVLTYLIQREDRIGNTPTIVKVTGVSTASIKRAVMKLENLGFLKKNNKPYIKGKIRGFTYTINETLCRTFMELRGKALLNDLLNEPLNELLYERTNGLLNERATGRANDCTTVPLYSSSSLLNTTTCEIESIISCHPEFGYWREKKLTAKQVEYWAKIAECNMDDIIQYLCYCRFEMVDLGREESEPIDDVFNWFYRMIERTGGYKKPNGYKSFREKQLEAERQLVEQKENEAREAETLYRKKIEAERSKQFWDMMNDREGDLYNQCFDSLSDFQKKRKSGKGFEMLMRSAFDRLTGEGDEAETASGLHSVHQEKGPA